MSGCLCLSIVCVVRKTPTSCLALVLSGLDSSVDGSLVCFGVGAIRHRVPVLLLARFLGKVLYQYCLSRVAREVPAPLVLSTFHPAFAYFAPPPEIPGGFGGSAGEEGGHVLAHRAPARLHVHAGLHVG